MKRKKKIAPGRLFWVGTFAVGVMSPGKGKRRVNDQMKRMDNEWKKAQNRIRALEEELVTSYTENKRLNKELRLSHAVNKELRFPPVGPPPQASQSVEAVTTSTQDDRPKKRLLAVRSFARPSTEETIPLPTASLGGIQVRHLAEKTTTDGVSEPATSATEAG